MTKKAISLVVIVATAVMLICLLGISGSAASERHSYLFYPVKNGEAKIPGLDPLSFPPENIVIP